MNRTDPYAPVDPAKGWGPALFRSFSTHDTRNISGKQKEERSVPSSPAASGWSPSLFRSSSCLDNRAERGRGLKAETDESDTAAQKSSGWSLFGSMTKLDVNRSNHGKDNTKKDAPRVRAGWPNFGSLANLGNANTLATERDSIKEASAARANELLLDFGNRSQSTSQLDSVRPTKTRATNRTSNSISRPMQLEIYEVPTCKAAPSATIKNIESNFLFGQVKQQSVALSDAETEAIQREIQQEQEKKNRRNAVIERNRMQSSNDRNALFTRMQEHKQKMREGGEEALVPQTGDKEIDVSPNTEEANATLLNDEYEEKKQDHSEHSRENQESDIGFPHEEEEEEEEGNRFEIEIGSEIRFKVKAVNFTRITTTMKGVQATTTTTSHAPNNGAFGLNGSGGGSASAGAGSGAAQSKAANGDSNNKEGDNGGAVRRRSSSADLSESASHPAPMQIVGSICEDGLGLTSWWKAAEEEEEEEEEGEGGEENGLEGEE
mmetsp:Transcript_1854/g.3821  ORF Transcript_1854/g.3821 Transcript_1854/m.3821 type:complete len:492 (-) Transcript_1854:53-1528(-)